MAIEYTFRWRLHLRLSAKTNRSKASTNYYSNSVATFRPIIQHNYDVELNPGPDVQLNIHCLYTNARSIVNKFDKLQALTTDVDVIAITESWLKQSIQNSEILPNLDFTIHRRDRTEHNDQRKGGVMLAICNTITNIRKSDIECSAEILACEFRPSGKKERFEGFSVYYRSSNSDLSYMKESTKSLLIASKATFNNIVIAGDFNLPNIDWKNITDTTDNIAYSYFVKTLKDHFLWQVVDFPTRNNSLPDLILTSIPAKISNIKGSQDILNADHKFINFCINLRIAKKPQELNAEFIILKGQIGKASNNI